MIMNNVHYAYRILRDLQEKEVLNVVIIQVMLIALKLITIAC